MISRRDILFQALARTPGGLSCRNLAAMISEDDSAEELGAVELLCVLSPNLREVDGTWRSYRLGKSGAVLLAFENYAKATGKRIFRIESAIAGLPVEYLPTEEEIVHIVDSSSGRFTMLSNRMIKFHE
jgi:hypothetical protein